MRRNMGVLEALGRDVSTGREPQALRDSEVQSKEQITTHARVLQQIDEIKLGERTNATGGDRERDHAHIGGIGVGVRERAIRGAQADVGQSKTVAYSEE